MGERRGLTRNDVIVIVVVVLVLIAIFVPSIDELRLCGQRTYCEVNLKGLWVATAVYAHDYDGAYPELPGKGAWSKELGFDYSMMRPAFGSGGAQELAGRTISASMYLLVREADTFPKSFVCLSSSQEAFDGHVPNPPSGRYPDITELWDFSDDPYEHVSYVMQNPYGNYPANNARGSEFAIAGDMSPWFDGGDILAPGDKTAPQVITWNKKRSYKYGNSSNHTASKKMFKFFGPGKSIRTGQNVVFADGHSVFKKTANCGVGKDNIYTFWSKDDEPSEQDRQGGKNPTGRDKENDAMSKEDSFLGI